MQPQMIPGLQQQGQSEISVLNSMNIPTSGRERAFWDANQQQASRFLTAQAQLHQQYVYCTFIKSRDLLVYAGFISEHPRYTSRSSNTYFVAGHLKHQFYFLLETLTLRFYNPNSPMLHRNECHHLHSRFYQQHHSLTTPPLFRFLPQVQALILLLNPPVHFSISIYSVK